MSNEQLGQTYIKYAIKPLVHHTRATNVTGSILQSRYSGVRQSVLIRERIEIANGSTANLE